jgi:hypothetical protein
MRRSLGIRDYFHIRTVVLTDGDFDTVLTPLANMVRVKVTSSDSGTSLFWRGVKEGTDGQADSTDTIALDADFCDVLSPIVTDSGWVDAQSSGIRVEADAGGCTVKVMWTSRELPTIA